jgi:transcriptional regulator of NAD metabolism
MEKKIGSDKFSSISVNDINNETKRMVDSLNMIHGSVGDFDIYKLLQVYFRDEQKRKIINEILKK